MRRHSVTSALALVLSAVIYGCPAAVEPPAPLDGSLDAPDGGPLADGATPDGATARCTRDGECDDGVYCNGQETCDPANASADERGCVVPADSPCPAGVACDEVADGCGDCASDPDADGDGRDAVACGGDDCDDADPNRAPGRAEVCDASDHDEDCDPTTFGIRDLDGDDEPDASCCNTDGAGALHCGSDCDDTRGSVGPTASEVCNGRDDDCNGAIDEGVLLTFYLDADGDGYGTDDLGVPSMTACAPPAMHVGSTTDCDDADPVTHPGAVDTCDPGLRDEDCSGTPNDRPGGCSCTAGASRPCEGTFGLCLSGTEACVDGAWAACSIGPVPEECNMLDDDCNDVVDNGVRVRCYADVDNDGFSTSASPAVEFCPVGGRPAVGGCPVNYTNRAPVAPNEDCDDTTGAVAPGAPETCNMRDDDCDAMIDDGVGIVCYLDGDEDGFASMGAPGMMACPVAGDCPAGTTDRQPLGVSTSDCSDGVATTHPGALEACDGVDNDCSGTIDDGMRVTCWDDGDDDGYAVAGAAMATYCPDSARIAVAGCPTNRTHRDPGPLTSRDCNDADDDIHPGAVELCDGVDNDCANGDDAMRVSCWADGDNDGYATTGASTSMQCPDPARTGVGLCPVNHTNRNPATSGLSDCDDTNPGISPGVAEMCSVPALDQNCNGTADEGILTCWRDVDGDGFPAAGAAMLAPTCTVMTGGYGGCGAGQTTRDPGPTGNRDCDDARATVSPLGTETCNSLDDNCNGTIDDGFLVPTRFYRDVDLDGFGSSVAVMLNWPSCAASMAPSGYATSSDDCCDSDNRAFPGVTDFHGAVRGCGGGFDFDCDGSEETMPILSACEHTPLACGAGGYCRQSLGGVWQTSGGCSTAACGVPVPVCSCAACTTLCTITPLPITEPQRCR